MLRGSDVASVVDAIRGSFDRGRAIHAADQLSPGWAFLDYPDVAGRAATEAALEPMLVYWLRLAVFCLVVAYGPEGDDSSALDKHLTRKRSRCPPNRGNPTVSVVTVLRP